MCTNLVLLCVCLLIFLLMECERRMKNDTFDYFLRTMSYRGKWYLNFGENGYGIFQELLSRIVI